MSLKKKEAWERTSNQEEAMMVSMVNMIVKCMYVDGWRGTGGGLRPGKVVGRCYWGVRLRQRV